MNNQEANIVAKELHKPVKHKFQKLKINIYTKDYIWGADLCEMEKCLKYKYILTVIDLCTRYAFAIPLVNKSADSVCNAFSLIINESGRKCEKLWVDRGKEFYNKRFMSFLENNDITLYSTKTGFHTTGNQEVEPKS